MSEHLVVRPQAVRRVTVVALVAAAFVACRAGSSLAPPAATPAAAATPTPLAATGGEAGWAEVDRLLGEQKLEAAAAVATAIRSAAAARQDDAEWTKALVREVQLRSALHGCEPATLTSGYRWELGLARYEEVRDSGQSFFMEWLPQGEYTLKYRLRATMAGSFRVGPATVQSLYAPEFNAYSAGHLLTITGM